MRKNCFILLLGLLSLVFVSTTQAVGSVRTIELDLAADGKLTPNKIEVKQNEPVLIKVTARFIEGDLKWPPDVFHELRFLYNQLSVFNTTIASQDSEESDNGVESRVVEMLWTPQFPATLLIRCLYHNDVVGTVTVKQ
jgi:hypothetical protein